MSSPWDGLRPAQGDTCRDERGECDGSCEAERLRIEVRRLERQIDGLALEKRHYMERARAGWASHDGMQSIAARAMREGLAECERLRWELEEMRAERNALRGALRRYVDARAAWLESDERNEGEAGAIVDEAHLHAVAVLGKRGAWARGLEQAEPAELDRLAASWQKEADRLEAERDAARDALALTTAALREVRAVLPRATGDVHPGDPAVVRGACELALAMVERVSGESEGSEG